MKCRLDNYQLPAVPPWDEIIARTKHDMAAQNFLSRHGLYMTIQAYHGGYQAAVSPLTYRDRGTARRPTRQQQQSSVAFPAHHRRPTPRQVLARLSDLATNGSRFNRQRIRAFFTASELREMAEIV
jgi:hypothetical protein